MAQGKCPLNGGRRNAGWYTEVGMIGCLGANESELEGVIRWLVVVEEYGMAIRGLDPGKGGLDSWVEKGSLWPCIRQPGR